MMYVGGGLGLTAGFIYALRNSPLAYKFYGTQFIASIALLTLLIKCDYYRNPILKHTLYVSWIGTMSLSVVPLINLASLPIIYDAILATGFTMGGLGIVTYYAPSEQFL